MDPTAGRRRDPSDFRGGIPVGNGDSAVTNWLRLHRQILRSDVSQSDELLGLFVRLLSMVNYREKWFKGQKIEPGAMVFAWRKLQDRLYPSAEDPPSINTLRHRIEQLESLGAVSVMTHPRCRFSILTVRNWEAYQRRTVSNTVAKSDTVADTVTDTVTDTVPDTESRRDKKVKKEKKNSESSSQSSKTNATKLTGFELWYSNYPRHVAMASAEKAYAKAIKYIQSAEKVNADDAEALLLKWTQERRQKLLETEERFRPHPATWLNGGRYRDPLTELMSSSSSESLEAKCAARDAALAAKAQVRSAPAKPKPERRPA
jgi:hypothetical protein